MSGLMGMNIRVPFQAGGEENSEEEMTALKVFYNMIPFLAVCVIGLLMSLIIFLWMSRKIKSVGMSELKMIKL
jgi:hypothetical protein